MAAVVAGGARWRGLHALAVLIELDDGADRIDLGGTVWLAIAHPDGVAFRRSRIVGGAGLGAPGGGPELALDCLRRLLQGLPVVEWIDF